MLLGIVLLLDELRFAWKEKTQCGDCSFVKCSTLARALCRQIKKLDTVRLELV
jgi:hypothetical protein